MATVIPELVSPERRSPAPMTELAVQRVTIYLQSVGLGFEKAAEAAGQIVREIQDQGLEETGGLATRAMERAAARVDAWLDELAAACPAPTIDLRAQLRWHVRPVLSRHPEGFLQIRDLPDDFPRAVLAAARPILPPAVPTAMPSAFLGGPPHPWQSLAAYAALVRYRFTSLLWRTWTRP